MKVFIIYCLHWTLGLSVCNCLCAGHVCPNAALARGQGTAQAGYDWAWYYLSLMGWTLSTLMGMPGMILQIFAKSLLIGIVRSKSMLIGIILFAIFAACSSPESPFIRNQVGSYADMVKANQLVLENDFKGAFKLYERACVDFALNDDLKGVIDCKINIALALIKQGNKKKAIKYLDEARSISLEFSLYESEGKVLLNLALIHIKEKELKNARDLLNKSVTLLKKYSQDQENMYKAYAYLGYVSIELGDGKMAIIGLNYALKSEIESTRSYAYANLARLNLRNKNFRQALEYAEKAFEIDKKESNSSYIVYDYFLISEIYYQMGDLDKALRSGKRALFIALALNNKRQIQRILGFLMKLFKEKGDSKNYQYYKKLRRNI